MQLTNNTHSQVMLGCMQQVKLPALPDRDVKKLDTLLAFMKENKNEPVNVYTFCKDKWGDNKLLYIYFSEYLRKNSFTSIQGQNRVAEYTWHQMITPAGLAFDGFKKEYARQYARGKRRKEKPKSSWYPLKGLASIVLVNLAFLRLRWYS